MTLTPTQDNVLAFLRTFISVNGYPPTMAEICHRFRWRSTNAATSVLAALERKGRITRVARIARGICLVEGP